MVGTCFNDSAFKNCIHNLTILVSLLNRNLSPLLSVETFKIEKEESYKLKTCRSSSKIKCLDEEMLDVRMALMDSSVASKIGINKAEQVHDHDGNYKISIERLNCTVTNMNFFDPLVEKGKHSLANQIMNEHTI